MTVLLSGDREEAVATVAKTVGIEKECIYSSLAPQQKSGVISSLQASGHHVAMVNVLCSGNIILLCIISITYIRYNLINLSYWPFRGSDLRWKLVIWMMSFVSLSSLTALSTSACKKFKSFLTILLWSISRPCAFEGFVSKVIQLTYLGSTWIGVSFDFFFSNFQFRNPHFLSQTIYLSQTSRKNT